MSFGGDRSKSFGDQLGLFGFSWDPLMISWNPLRMIWEQLGSSRLCVVTQCGSVVTLFNRFVLFRDHLKLVWDKMLSVGNQLILWRPAVTGAFGTLVRN